MYKVKEAADVLGVTRVEIFEIMVSQRELFEPYTSKSNSITYISEEGLALLRQMLKRDVPFMNEPVSQAAVSEADAYGTEIIEREEDLETDYLDAEATLEDAEDFEDSLSETFQTKTDPLEDIEAADDLIGQWLREIQVEDEAADQQDEMLRQMRTQVTQMRNKILSLDSEIRRKDDAIRHYHEIMKDDVRWLEDLERKVQLIVKHGLLEKSEAEVDSGEEDKNNRFKFFKK